MQAEFGGPTRREDDPHHVVDERVVHEHTSGDLLQAQELLVVEHLLRFGSGNTHPVDDLAFFLHRRVVDEDLEQEAVALCFRERVDASFSMGFCVAITRNGSGIGKVLPPMVTWRSAITSSSADCTFAGARLISSASTKFATTGPSSVSNSSRPCR